MQHTSRRFSALSLVLALALGGCSPDAATREGDTSNGLYRVAWWTDPDPIPFSELFALEISVQDAAGDAVSGASLTVDATMPAHGHGMQTQPTVESLGSGRYRVEGMKFHMRGSWTVTVEVDGTAGRDTASFEEEYY